MLRRTHLCGLMWEVTEMLEAAMMILTRRYHIRTVPPEDFLAASVDSEK